MKTSESIKEIGIALGQYQNRVPYLKKDSQNHRNKYVSLPELNRKAYPVMAEFGLSMTQFPDEAADGKPALTSRLMHKSGEWMEATFPLGTEWIKGQNPMQNIGIALTYMCRYAKSAILGTSGGDDDAIGLEDDSNEATIAPPKSASKVPNFKPQPTTQLFKTAMGECLDVEALEKARTRGKKYGDIWDATCDETYTDMLMTLTDPANQGAKK